MNQTRIKFAILLTLNLLLLIGIIWGGTALFRHYQIKHMEVNIEDTIDKNNQQHEKNQFSHKSGQLGRSLVTLYAPLVDGKEIPAISQFFEREIKKIEQVSSKKSDVIEELIFLEGKVNPCQLATVDEVSVEKVSYPVSLEKGVGKEKKERLDLIYLNQEKKRLNLSDLFLNDEVAREKFLFEVKKTLLENGKTQEQAQAVRDALASKEMMDWNFTYENSHFHLKVDDHEQMSISLDCFYDEIDKNYLQGEDLIACEAYLIRKQQKVVALTFDDGPKAETTPQVLDILKRYHAKATFYIVGSHVAGNESILKRELEEGHQLGNHTWSHPQLPTLSNSVIADEINLTQDAIFKATGVRPNSMRPPYGEINANVLKIAQLPAIEWSVDSLDWKNRKTASILENVKASVESGAIILFHDIHPTTVEALPTVLDYLSLRDINLLL